MNTPKFVTWVQADPEHLAAAQESYLAYMSLREEGKVQVDNTMLSSRVDMLKRLLVDPRSVRGFLGFGNHTVRHLNSYGLGPHPQHSMTSNCWWPHLLSII